MALDNQADVVTAVDTDGPDVVDVADVERSDAPEPTFEHAEESHENGAGNGASSASAVPAVSAAEAAVATNGAHAEPEQAGRSARKRTSRQRRLLLASAGAAAAETETGVPPGGDAEPVPPVDPSGPVDPLLAAPAVAEEAEEAEEAEPVAAVAAPAPTALAAAALYAPPARTAPLPLVTTEPETSAQPETEAVPVVVPVQPVPPPPQPRRRARPRVRKVTRIVRSVDAWSVFKVALIFFIAMGVVLMTAGILLWNLAQSTGTLDNVEGFFQEAFNYDTFELQSEPLFRAGLVLTALFIVAGTGLTVVMAVLFNLIADLTGGIRLTVLEREVVARSDVQTRRRRKLWAPKPAPRPTAPPPDLAGMPAPPPLEQPAKRPH